jgi:hypothetical protein
MPDDTRSQAEFKKAPPQVQALIKAVMKEERPVMHLRRRPDINQKLLELVKTIVQ